MTPETGTETETGRTAAAPVLRLDTHGPEETRALGERLGRLARPGDVLLLSGNLGAGKTVVAQGIGRGLGTPTVVNSPTFVLVSEHRGGRLPLLHADLYRLGDQAEIDALALDEIRAGGVLVLEWPERATAGLPADHLALRLTPPAATAASATAATAASVTAAPDRRRLTLTAHGPAAATWLARLRADLEREPLSAPAATAASTTAATAASTTARPGGG